MAQEDVLSILLYLDILECGQSSNHPRQCDPMDQANFGNPRSEKEDDGMRKNGFAIFHVFHFDFNPFFIFIFHYSFSQKKTFFFIFHFLLTLCVSSYFLHSFMFFDESSGMRKSGFAIFHVFHFEFTQFFTCFIFAFFPHVSLFQVFLSKNMFFHFSFSFVFTFFLFLTIVVIFVFCVLIFSLFFCLSQSVRTEDGHNAMMKLDTFSLIPQLEPRSTWM